MTSQKSIAPFLGALLLLPLSSALAVKAADGLGGEKSNTLGTDLTNGEPWKNVVSSGAGSGVYLGGGWILSAGHVGFDNQVFLGGELFTATDLDCRFRITNSDLTLADLILYRLDEAPIDDASYQLDIGGLDERDSGVAMIGFGGGTRAWGFNDVETILGPNDNIGISSGIYYTETVYSDFDLFTNNDAHGISGDSGGGVFIPDGSGGWDVGGIMLYVAEEQLPHETYFADLDIYGNQINSLMANHGDAPIRAIPEPTSLLLVAVGLGLFGLGRRRSR